eukprot:980095-Pyramimonas_sp.AAC.1
MADQCRTGSPPPTPDALIQNAADNKIPFPGRFNPPLPDRTREPELAGRSAAKRRSGRQIQTLL